uniref:Uncharacterized protein n=1 Tax=Physcomitrium patens TaxID=3218 RepID=A0A2K1KP18_PHYPA|nr:hypothetical protein PHYPA_006417 [Physcomitrium patens]
MCKFIGHVLVCFDKETWNTIANIY